MSSDTAGPSSGASVPAAPVAPIPVAYFTDSGAVQPLQAILRIIGLLMLLVGIVRLAIVPFQLTNMSRFSMASAYPDWYRAAWVVGSIATAVLSIWTIVAAVSMLRRPPRLRSWVVAWAWASIAMTVYAASLNVLQVTYISQVGPWGIASVLYQLTERLSSLLVPIVAMILLSRAEVRQLFASSAVEV